MMQFPFARAQQGATLVVGLVMLLLITLMVVASFTISTGNVQSVGNMQFRSEAIASASEAIEASLGLSSLPAGYGVPVDANNDGEVDYTVAVTRTCLRASSLAVGAEEGSGSSVSLGFGSATSDYMVLWDYDAVVTDTVTGARARVRQGVRQRLSQIQCDAQCPPAAGVPCS